MKSSIILASLSVGLAAADFQIFWTREQVDGLEGLSFFNSAPSCSDAGNSVSVVNYGGRNDASSGGHACDGCSGGNARDWDIERLEFYDGGDDNDNSITTEGVGSITLYKDRDYELVWKKDGWEGVRGNCRRTSDQELADCVVKTGIKLFECETDLIIRGEFSGN